MRKSSRGVLEEKKRHKALLEQVSLVPRTDTSRWMWMVMHMDIVLMEGVTCDTIREFVCRCELKGNVQGQKSHVACMVALGLHACLHRVREGIGYWFGLEGDGVRFISCVWMCGLESWILHMLPWFEQEGRFFLSMCVLDIVLLHSDDTFEYHDNRGDDRKVLDGDGVELVCCSLHFVTIQLMDGMEAAEDMARLVGLIDNALMVLSGMDGSPDGSSGWQKRIMEDIARLSAWIDEQCCEGSLESLLCRLKSRLMLFQYKKVSDGTTKRPEDGCCINDDEEQKEIEDRRRRSVITMMRAAFDSVLYWSTSPNDVSDEYIAYACWSVSNTLFLEETSIVSNHHPSPVADYKVLCNTLERLVGDTERRSECDQALEQIACWALSSHVDDVHIQQQLVDLYEEKLNSSSVAHLEFIEDRHVSLQYEWVRHQMLLMGNKLAVDDTSAGGIVVGQQLEARMKTIRNLVFPAVLLCPYSLLHKLFNAAVTNRNEVWILSSICEVFPNLMQLRSVDCPPISEYHHGTELSRLLVDRVITSKGISEEEESSLLYMVEVFMNATPSILSLGMFRNDILPMLSSPGASPEFATKFVKRILQLSSVRSVHDLLLSGESDTASPYAVAALQTCLYYLEFDNRYQSLGISTHDGINSDVISSYFDKSSLQNIQDIVLLIAECLMDCDASDAQRILTTVEYQGHPWARLYFGIDFTEDEAHYILKLNPKQSCLAGENCFGVKNTAFHQAFELAALGSIQAQMLKHLAHEYKSIDDLRCDIVRSVSCIASVCTPSEAQHLLHGVEVIAGDVCIGAQNTSVSNAFAKPYIIQACTRAMVAEIGIKSVHSMVDHTYYAQASMALSDVGRYCLQSISEFAPSISPMLALRLFGEVLQCYTSLTTTLKEKNLHPDSIQSSSIEAIISSLAQHIVRKHSRALSEQENSSIVNRASDMVNQASLNDTQYMTALRSLFKT